MPKLIKGWEDLVGLESENYKLDIDVESGSGWIRPKDEDKYDNEEYYLHHVYLSTHTFYGHNYKQSTELLQSYGFNVQLVNWDEDGDDS